MQVWFWPVFEKSGLRITCSSLSKQKGSIPKFDCFFGIDLHNFVTIPYFRAISFFCAVTPDMINPARVLLPLCEASIKFLLHALIEFWIVYMPDCSVWLFCKPPSDLKTLASGPHIWSCTSQRRSFWRRCTLKMQGRPAAYKLLTPVLIKSMR